MRGVWHGTRIAISGALISVGVFGMLPIAVNAMTEQLTYHGRISNPDGTLISKEHAACLVEGETDTCDFRARLYTAKEGGTLVWEEVIHNQELGDHGGAFTLALNCGGHFDTCARNGGPDFGTQDLYVDIAFDPSGNADFDEGETFTPRALLAAAPYAFAALSAQKFNGLTHTQFVRTDVASTIAHDTQLTIAGTLSVEGDVQIADPEIALMGATTNFSASGRISFNQTQLVLAQNGFIGVGTTTPDARMHLVGTDGASVIHAVNTHMGTSAPLIVAQTTDTTQQLFSGGAVSDAWARIVVNGAGTVLFGSGSAAQDTVLYRSAPQTLKTDGALIAAGIGIGVAVPTHPIDTATGAHLTVGGVWTNSSDVHRKENFTPVDGKDILDRLARLQITRWNYKSEDATTTHIGPTAQDFFALFGLGGSDTSISTIDPAGIALVGIQALSAHVRALEDELADIKKRSDDAVMRADVYDVTENLQEKIDALTEQYRTLADAYLAIATVPDGISPEDETQDDSVNDDSRARDAAQPAVRYQGTIVFPADTEETQQEDRFVAVSVPELQEDAVISLIPRSATEGVVPYVAARTQENVFIIRSDVPVLVPITIDWAVY